MLAHAAIGGYKHAAMHACTLADRAQLSGLQWRWSVTRPHGAIKRGCRTLDQTIMMCGDESSECAVCCACSAHNGAQACASLIDDEGLHGVASVSVRARNTVQSDAQHGDTAAGSWGAAANSCSPRVYSQREHSQHTHFTSQRLRRCLEACEAARYVVSTARAAIWRVWRSGSITTAASSAVAEPF